MRLYLVSGRGFVSVNFDQTVNEKEYRETIRELWEVLVNLLPAEMDTSYADRVRRKNPYITNVFRESKTEISTVFAAADECFVSVYEVLQKWDLIPEWPRKTAYSWDLSAITPEETKTAIQSLDSWFDTIFS